MAVQERVQPQTQDNSLPTVDVIILSWNRLEPTLEAIESARRQEGVRVNVIVVDQGSKEEQVAALRPLAARGDITLKEAGVNKGPGEGRNIAMALGTSEFIVGIDNDAELESPDTLAHVVRRMEADPTIGLLAFRIKNFYTRQDDLLSLSVYPEALLSRLDKEFLTTRYTACGHALRRSVLNRTRGYDASLFFCCEEHDLAYQIINAGYKVIYDPKAVVLHKVSPEARFWWQRDRYYYLVRNSIYLDYKYFQSPSNLVKYFIGYPIKGVYNRVPGQGIRGAFDSIPMVRRLDAQSCIPLTPEAKQYIWDNDLKYRGSLMTRVRRDLLKLLAPPK
jgi:GT2 family glycosyltransferase